ncbi:unnamed protein product, partial [Prorocentrum cordatum]
MAFAPASGSVVVYQGSSAGASSPSGSPVRALAVVVAGPLPNGTYDLDCARGVVAGELLPAAGEAVEYHSSSLQAWIPGRVLRPGAAAGTLDLDCKEAADLRRVRLLQAPPSSAAGARDAHAPAAASGVGGGGPPKLQPGDHCFYRSSTHGWLAAQVQHFSAEDGGEAAPAAGWDLRPQREASRATREHSLHPGGLRRGIPQRLSAQLDPGHGAAPGPGPRDLRPRLQGKGEHGTRFSSASDPAPGRARKPSGGTRAQDAQEWPFPLLASGAGALVCSDRWTRCVGQQQLACLDVAPRTPLKPRSTNVR